MKFHQDTKEQKKHLSIRPTKKNIVYIITPQMDQDSIMKSLIHPVMNSRLPVQMRLRPKPIEVLFSKKYHGTAQSAPTPVLFIFSISISRSFFLSTLPTALVGSAEINSTIFGTL